MIGNDVVDLRHPSVQPGSRHVRFDARVFSRAEREALSASGAPDRLRWMYWAAKEAAYKVHKKLDARTVWSPRRFVVSLDADLSGCVEHEGVSYPAWIEEDGERVHALVTTGLPREESLRWQVAQLAVGQDESLAARALAVAGLAPVLGVPAASLAVATRDRIPFLERDGAPTGVDLSLSHHGRFVAWAADLRGAASEEGPIAERGAVA